MEENAAQFKLEIIIRNWGHLSKFGPIQIWSQIHDEAPGEKELRWIDSKGKRVRGGLNTFESVKRGLLTINGELQWLWVKDFSWCSCPLGGTFSISLIININQLPRLGFLKIHLNVFFEHFQIFELPFHGKAATLSSPFPSLRSLLWSPTPPPLSGSNSLKMTGDLERGEMPWLIWHFLENFECFS